MIKVIPLSAILLVFNISADNFFFNTSNNHGSIGLINTPTARFYSSPAGSLNLYRGFPDRIVTLSLYPYDWLEASIFYSSIKDKEYGPDISQDYKDKGFNLKIRLKDQGNFPAIALGLNDLGGTGLYSSEYFVSSYDWGRFDYHVGVGWGRLNQFENLKNPFTYLSNDFKSRIRDEGYGGTFNSKKYFSDPNISLFGGISYALNQNYVLKLEYDPIRTPGSIGHKLRKSDLSFGLTYLSKNYTAGFNYERGTNFSFNLSYRDNFFLPESSYKKYDKKTNDKYKDLIKTLEINGIGVSEIKKSESVISLSVTQYLHDLETLEKIIDHSIEDSDIEEKIVKTYKIAGLKVINNDNLKDYDLIYTSEPKHLNHNFSINIRPFIAAREDFLKAAVLLEHDLEFIISEHLFFSTNIKLSLIDNFDDLKFPPVDVYPQQVRSDIKKYLNNLGEKPSIGRAQLEYFRTLKKNNHILLSAGIFEDMFAGYGFEYLYYDNTKNFNWGYEAHKVYKRDYKFGFGLLDYENITHHINMYYKNRRLVPFDIKLSYGEYLGGDIGTTIELSRSFKRGVKIGLFSTFTNVSFDDYGEGSFDKGIFFSIPFGKNRRISNFVWRPLTKDPGSKLIRKNDVYSLANKYSSI